MRPLVTAVDITDVVRRNEKTLHVTGETIITPAARDAARDHGIAIVVAGSSENSAGTSTQKKGSVQGIDHEALVRLVQNVIASMGIGPKEQGLAVRQVDPSGLCIVNGRTIGAGSLSGGSEREIISSGDCSVMQAGVLCLDAKPYMRKAGCDLIGYVIEGTVTCTVNGREFAAQGGDILYLPATARVSLSSAAKAKVFFVTCPASRNTHS